MHVEIKDWETGKYVGGNGPRELPALPRKNEYIWGEGQLWRVATVEYKMSGHIILWVVQPQPGEEAAKMIRYWAGAR